MNEIYVHEETIYVVTPEGQCACMKISELRSALVPERIDTCGVILPDGVKSALTKRNVTVLVHQTPPRVHGFKWIAAGSPAHFGQGARYRPVRLALPYVVLLAVFVTGPDGKVLPTSQNECFFRVAPLEDLDGGGELFYPALLNCSKFRVQDGHPLSWLCTQHLNFATLAREADLNRRVRRTIQALLHCLFETGFNYSSEHHEGSSWFTESSKVDPRIASVEKWEEASKQNPLFVLDVPWLKTGFTVRQVADRIFQQTGSGARGIVTEADLARLILNRKKAA
jgi:hypothetical protein